MNKVFLDELNNICPGIEILKDEPMSSHTTFKVGGPAQYFIKPSIEELIKIVELCSVHNMPCTVIGNGSNLLVKDGGIDGVVLCIGTNASTVAVNGNIIEAEAGTTLSTISRVALDNSLTGLEFAANIPGTVGGAVIMNAGAYGGEISDVFVSAQVYVPGVGVEVWDADKMNLSYRHSRAADEGAIVLSVKFMLKEGAKEVISMVMEKNRVARAEKQPIDYPSAGSTFKRPEGYFAAKLIDDAGLRGFTVGGAMVSSKHTGFVINKGNAKAADILSLMSKIIVIVQDKFSVTLEPEVRILGRD